MKIIKVSLETHGKLVNAKSTLDFVSFDKVIDVLCSKSNLYFLKNYDGTNEEDIRNYIAGLLKAQDKYLQKQMGRPMAKFADFEKMYWHRLVHLDNDFADLNFKIDALIKIAKKEIGIQVGDEVEDFQTRVEENKKKDKINESQLEKFKRLLTMSEETNQQMQIVIQTEKAKLNYLVHKFKKKDTMFGGKTQYELILSEDEYKMLLK